MRTGRIVLAAGVVVALAGCGPDGAAVEGGAATIDVTFTTLSDTPVDRRADAAIAWTGDAFLVTGGVVGGEKFGDDGEPETPDDGPVETLASEGDTLVGSLPVDLYDPDADAWTSPSPSPLDARSRHVAVWTGDEVVVWGGTARRNGVGDLLDAAAWDPDTDTWRALPDSPIGTDRSNAEAVALGRYVVIGGGAGPRSDRDGQLLVLDLAADTWSVLPGNGRVVDLHVLDERRALALSVVPAGDDGSEFLVEEVRVTEQGVTRAPFGQPVPDPTRDAEAPDDAFPFAAGLVGSGGSAALVVEPANMLAVVHPLPYEDGADETTLRVDGLTAGANLDGFGNAPQLMADDAWVTIALRGAPPTVAWDPTTSTARAVEATPDSTCINGRAWAAGEAIALVTGAECSGEVVRATRRG